MRQNMISILYDMYTEIGLDAYHVGRFSSKCLEPRTKLPILSQCIMSIPDATLARRHCCAANPFTELEHENWQRGVQAYADGFGPLTSQAIPTLLEQADYPNLDGESTHLLDVACGPGQVVSKAISIAKEAKHGSDGDGVGCNRKYLFTALDFSENFLALAKQNIAADHPGTEVTFVEGDAQSMPFDDESFDSITCNFGILHLADPDAFLKESHRVLRPGGALSFSSWAQPPSTEGFDLILGSIEAAGNPDVSLPEGPPFFRFSDEDEIRRSLGNALFHDVHVKKVEPMEWNIRDADHLYQVLLEGTARTREILRGQSAEQTRAVKEELRRRWKDVTDGGEKPLRMPAIISSGRKSGVFGINEDS